MTAPGRIAPRSGNIERAMTGALPTMWNRPAGASVGAAVGVPVAGTVWELAAEGAPVAAGDWQAPTTAASATARREVRRERVTPDGSISLPAPARRRA